VDISTVLSVLAVAAFLIVGALFHLWVLLLVLFGGSAALVLLRRVLGTDEPNRADSTALILVIVACGVLAGTELLYVRDVFDGGSNYRMNTVFKFYYQAWTMLGLAGAYGAYRGWRILEGLFPRYVGVAALTVVALGAAGGGVYTFLAPQSSIQDFGDRSLDGMAWLSSIHPGDLAAVEWLRAHARGAPVELETVGDASHPDDYRPEFARIATFSGLPTVMGWPGHESQWRPDDPGVGARANDVREIYSSAGVGSTRGLLLKYHVKYVVVGETERSLYKRASLLKFARFMHVAFQSGNTLIYTW
jgi:uncharacterized membrane protein